MKKKKNSSDDMNENLSQILNKTMSNLGELDNTKASIAAGSAKENPNKKKRAARPVTAQVRSDGKMGLHHKGLRNNLMVTQTKDS